MLNKLYYQTSNRRKYKEEFKMTKELAIYLLESKDVWLTYEGRKRLIELLEGKEVVQHI